jgi:hypothetical protein
VSTALTFRAFPFVEVAAIGSVDVTAICALHGPDALIVVRTRMAGLCQQFLLVAVLVADLACHAQPLHFSVSLMIYVKTARGESRAAEFLYRSPAAIALAV